MPTQMPSSRPTGGDTLAHRVVEPCREPAGGARDVADAGDHRERRVAHRVGSVETVGVGTRALEARRDAAQVARTVVGEDDLHATALRRRTPASPGAHACRSARPSALKAASAT